MAAIPVNKPLESSETTVAKLDLQAGPHTFTFVNHKQVLNVENGEGNQVTLTIVGDGVTTANCPGLDPIDLSGGFAFVVDTGANETLHTSTVSQYLGAEGNNVTVTITGTVTGASFAWLSETS